MNLGYHRANTGKALRDDPPAFPTTKGKLWIMAGAGAQEAWIPGLTLVGSEVSRWSWAVRLT